MHEEVGGQKALLDPLTKKWGVNWARWPRASAVYVNLVQLIPPFLPPLVTKQSLWEWVTAFYVLEVLLVIQPTMLEALKEMQSTDLSQWPGLIFSSSAIALLMEGVLLVPTYDTTVQRMYRTGLVCAVVHCLCMCG